MLAERGEKNTKNLTVCHILKRWYWRKDQVEGPGRENRSYEEGGICLAGGDDERPHSK